MTWFAIRPQDVWLFRDGRPFNAGEDNSARSLFPPTPLTVQGALRQKISESNGLSFHEYRKGTSTRAKTVGGYIGTYTEQEKELTTGAFEMRGPFPGVHMDNNSVEPLFPCPADFIVHTHQQTKRFDASYISEPGHPVVASDIDSVQQADQTINTDDKKAESACQFLHVIDGYENLPGHWMSGQAFAIYLDKKQDSIPAEMFVQPEQPDSPANQDERPTSAKQAIETSKHILPAELVYKYENRFGVSTDSQTSSYVKGMLYQTQYVRPTDGVSLLVHVTGKHDDSHVEGSMTIGGEQRQASNQTVQVTGFPQHPDTLPDYFKVIFLTPAYFKRGWLPEAPWKDLFGVDVELVGAALYRPQRIGGWNSAAGDGNGAQRTMHNYVAPGSVYYFQTDKSFAPPATLTETPPGIASAAQIGFGQVAYTTWNTDN